MLEPEAKIQMRDEDGVRMYSVVRVYRDGVCDICKEDVLATAEISSTEIYEDDETRADTLDICQGCAYRVAALFDARNAGKELYCGVMQDAD